jgi:hypothetical protein
VEAPTGVDDLAVIEDVPSALANELPIVEAVLVEEVDVPVLKVFMARGRISSRETLQQIFLWTPLKYLPLAKLLGMDLLTMLLFNFPQMWSPQQLTSTRRTIHKPKIKISLFMNHFLPLYLFQVRKFM